MNLKIFLDDISSAEDSYEMNQLASLIEEECDVEVIREKKDSSQGVRDGGLLTAIAIVSLSVGMYQAVIATLQYWDSRQTKYTVSVTLGNATMLSENMSESQAKREFETYAARSPDGYVNIQISHTE